MNRSYADVAGDRLVPYFDADRSAIPALPPHHIERPPLFDLLDLGAERPLTLLSAPAGGGKTTLIASWLRRRQPRYPALWISLDQAGEHVWVEVLIRIAAAGLVAPPPPGISDEEALGRLGQVVTPVLVVLDDMPAEPDPVLLAGLEHLVERGQRRLRLIVAGRADPPLPLELWRTGGLLMHLHAAELAFTRTDASTFLAAHGVLLSDPALLELYALTEGWPVALRLTALSMQGHPEPERLVPEIALHDRGLGDYLMGEVLDNVRHGERELLLRMSVVDSVTPELAERLTGRPDAAATLASLEQSHLFVVRHGGRHPWYALHPLLSLLLYDELRQRAPELASDTHRRAAEWYGENGMPADAIRHALAARWWDRAAATVRGQWPQVLPGRYVRTLKGAATAPPQRALGDPWLVLAFAVERLDAGDLVAATTYLRLVDSMEHGLGGQELEQLRRAVAAVRMSHAYHAAEPEMIHDTVRDEPESSFPSSAEVRVFALLAVGAAYLYQANLSAAEPVLSDALRLARGLRLTQCRIAVLRQLALVNAFRGALRAAIRCTDEILAEAATGDRRFCQGSAWADLALAEVYYQQDRLGDASVCVERALGASALGDLTPSSLVTFIRCRVRGGSGDRYAAAIALAATRRQLYVGHTHPVVAQLLLLAEADLRLAAGQTVTARRLLDELNPSPQLLPWAALSQAKVCLAERRPTAAVAILRPEMDTPDPSPAWTVEAALLYAEALVAQGDRPLAGPWIARALEVAVQDDIRRPFSARGRAAYELLRTWQPEDPQHQRLAEEFVASLAIPALALEGVDAAAPAEALTEREMTVLRYLQGMMSTAEIASVLFVSINTVKTHIKSIYRKLGAGRRREAVERAHQLHLL
jgi:LuxR family maltose regulon positive regulatory protein